MFTEINMKSIRNARKQIAFPLFTLGMPSVSSLESGKVKQLQASCGNDMVM
jgi:hypothetical protein